MCILPVIIFALIDISSHRISIIYFVIPQKDIPLVYALSLRERDFEYKNMQIIENMAIKTAIYFHLLPFFERTCASDVKQIQFIKKQSLTVKLGVILQIRFNSISLGVSDFRDV